MGGGQQGGGEGHPHPSCPPRWGVRRRDDDPFSPPILAWGKESAGDGHPSTWGGWGVCPPQGQAGGVARGGGGGTLGSAPFSSTSSGALVVPARGSPSSRHRQQKRDWRMLRLRGFLAGAWVPGEGEGERGRGSGAPTGEPPPTLARWVSQARGVGRWQGGAPHTLIGPRHPSTCPSCPAKRRRRGSATDTSVWRPPTASPHPHPHG